MADKLPAAEATVPAAAPAPAIETDAVVIGAGPIGLFQVFELGLLGLRAELVDSLPVLGGQCALLYPDKPIFDIPGTPRCTGLELVSRLQQQVAPFLTRFHLDQEVGVVAREEDGRFRVETAAGTLIRAGVVVIAGGVGSFQPRRLKLEGLAAHEGRQLFYRAPTRADVAGQRLLIIGDGDEALEAAIAAAQPGSEAAASVTLMHRRDDFKASAERLQRFAALRAQGRIGFVAGVPLAVVDEGHRLTGLSVSRAGGGEPQVLPVDRLLVLTGLSPKLGPIASWGLALDRKQLIVDTETFETDTPGIYAVGDVNTYPGKKKLIVCGFHEATLAAHAAAARLFPERAGPLEYTTTSPRLRGLLGA